MKHYFILLEINDEQMKEFQAREFKSHLDNLKSFAKRNGDFLFYLTDEKSFTDFKKKLKEVSKQWIGS